MNRMRFPRAPRFRRAAQAGFTLVEVCTAAALLTLVIAAMLTSQTAALNLTKTTRDTNAAVAELEAAMEEIFLLPIEDIPDPAGLYPDGVPIAKWNDHNLKGEQIVPSYPGFDGTTIPDPLEVVLTITWEDAHGRPRELALASMKTR